MRPTASGQALGGQLSLPVNCVLSAATARPPCSARRRREPTHLRPRTGERESPAGAAFMTCATALCAPVPPGEARTPPTERRCSRHSRRHTRRRTRREPAGRAHRAPRSSDPSIEGARTLVLSASTGAVAVFRSFQRMKAARQSRRGRVGVPPFGADFRNRVASSLTKDYIPNTGTKTCEIPALEPLFADWQLSDLMIERAASKRIGVQFPPWLLKRKNECGKRV